MNNQNIELIVRAIEAQKPMRFEYVKEGKIRGHRIGNPHIIFRGTTKDGIPRTWCHIVQTGGVSDTLQVFPDWRMFITDSIQDVQIIQDEQSFEIFDGYNPESHIYVGTQILAKV